MATEAATKKKSFSEKKDWEKEIPTIFKRGYKVRVSGVEGKTVLDIREHVETEKFRGFTKKGLWLGSKKEIVGLRDILNSVLAEYFEENDVNP